MNALIFQVCVSAVAGWVVAAGIVGHLLPNGHHPDPALLEMSLPEPGLGNIAHEPRCVQNKDRADITFVRQHALHHAPELDAIVVSRSHPGLDVFTDNAESVTARVLPHRLELRGKGQILLRLLWVAHARVEHSTCAFATNRLPSSWHHSSRSHPEPAPPAAATARPPREEAQMEPGVYLGSAEAACCGHDGHALE